MAPKSRATNGKGGRGGGRKAPKPARLGTRNITRWSANKDITLLCALAKECRRDKFVPNWNKVARWIGPNITGAAVEQHIAKLYSKLVQHRAAHEPKPKKKKTQHPEGEEDHPDYAKEEEDWGKGNEALANIFYDKPDHSAMRQVKDEVESGDDDDDNEDDQDYMAGNPNELLLGGTKYLATNFDEAEESFVPKFEGSIGGGMYPAKHELSTMGSSMFPFDGDMMSMKSGNVGIDNQYNYASYPIKTENWPSSPAQNPFGMAPAFDPHTGMNSPRLMHRFQQNPLLQNQRQSMANPLNHRQRQPNMVPYGMGQNRSASFTPSTEMSPMFHGNNMEAAPGYGSDNSVRLLEYHPMSHHSLKNTEERQHPRNLNPYGPPTPVFETTAANENKSLENVLSGTSENEGDGYYGNTNFIDQYLNQDPDNFEG